MVGLAQSGRARPWQISAALTAVRQAFPADKVRVGRSTLGGTVLHIIVDPGPVEDPREFLTWRPRGLRTAFPVLAACPDEAAVARLVEGAVPRIARGTVVEIGLEATRRRASGSDGRSTVRGVVCRPNPSDHLAIRPSDSGRST